MKVFMYIFLFLVTSLSYSRDEVQPKLIKEVRGENNINYRVVGSLGKSHDLPCIGLDQAKNIYTPADLYPSAAKCILEGKDKEGAEIFFLAGVYAVYDALRITDRTARGARRVLIMKNISPIPSEKKKGFIIEMDHVVDGRSKQSLEFCAKVKKIGKPDYYPQYMIFHGMKAISGNIEGKGLVKDYDPDEVWIEAYSALKWCSK